MYLGRSSSACLQSCNVVQVWKLSATDLCEVARNSVLHSGFPHQVKAVLSCDNCRMSWLHARRPHDCKAWPAKRLPWYSEDLSLINDIR